MESQHLNHRIFQLLFSYYPHVNGLVRVPKYDNNFQCVNTIYGNRDNISISFELALLHYKELLRDVNDLFKQSNIFQK